MSAGKLPEGWVKTEIGDIADVISGGTPKSGIAENFAPSGEGIAWLTPADLSGYKKKFISHGARDLSTDGYSSCSAKLMPAGSILFSSRAPIGYVAVASNEIATNQGFKSFVFTSDIYPDYAYYYLRNIRHLAEEMGTGTTFKEISGSSAKTLPFVATPLAEQKIIAEKLDTLLAQVDSTKARLEQIPQILKRFRQAVLAAAISGRLISNSNTPDTQPKFIKFEDILKDKKQLSYGVLKPGDYEEYGVPMIRVMDIGEWGNFNKTDIFKISQKLSLEFKRTIVEEGDIILSIMATIGRAAIVPKYLTGANVNRALAVIKLSDKVLPKYVLLQLHSPQFQETFVNKQMGSAQKRINLADLRKFDIWVPDIEYQHEIVRRVEQLFAYADSIEKQVNNALARVNNLTQSILAKAFRGELTAQWRAENLELISGENSAAALLEKIKAERAASSGKKTSRKKS